MRVWSPIRAWSVNRGSIIVCSLIYESKKNISTTQYLSPSPSILLLSPSPLPHSVYVMQRPEGTVTLRMCVSGDKSEPTLIM